MGFYSGYSTISMSTYEQYLNHKYRPLKSFKDKDMAIATATGYAEMNPHVETRVVRISGQQTYRAISRIV